MQKITVRIGKDGQVKVRMEGWKGPECVELTKVLREAIGETTEIEHTEEYYETPETETEGPVLEVE